MCGVCRCPSYHLFPHLVLIMRKEIWCLCRRQYIQITSPFPYHQFFCRPHYVRCLRRSIVHSSERQNSATDSVPIVSFVSCNILIVDLCSGSVERIGYTSKRVSAPDHHRRLHIYVKHDPYPSQTSPRGGYPIHGRIQSLLSTRERRTQVGRNHRDEGRDGNRQRPLEGHVLRGRDMHL